MSDNIKLNLNDYTFDGGIFSSDIDKSGGIPITYGNVGQIEITDSLYNLNLEGNIIFNNPYNIIENQIDFKANNQNFINITLIPNLPNGQQPNIKLSVWGAINEVGNANSEKANSNALMCSFISPEEAAMEELKASNLYGDQNTPTPLRINGPLGPHLKKIFQRIHTQEPIIKLYKNEQLVDEIDGEQSLSYTIPLHYTLYDLYEFILKYYFVTEGNLPCQCYVNLKKGNKSAPTYTIVPLISLLKNIPNPKATEHFIIGNQGNQTKSNNTGGAAAAKGSKNHINSYSFSNVAYTVSNKEFVDICVQKTSSPDNIQILEYIRLKDVRNGLNDIIQTGLSKFYTDPKLNVDLDDSKPGDKSLNYKVISFPTELKYKETATASLVSNCLLNNMELQFITNGAIYRTAGEYITIVKEDVGDNSFTNIDNRVLGQWLVVEIKHIISGDKYYNVFKCVKPFTGKFKNTN